VGESTRIPAPRRGRRRWRARADRRPVPRRPRGRRARAPLHRRIPTGPAGQQPQRACSQSHAEPVHPTGITRARRSSGRGAEPTDFVLPRIHGLSALGGTSLDPILRNMGVTTIVGTGVSVNVAPWASHSTR
jgi:nicotinamidase-related amidase